MQPPNMTGGAQPPPPTGTAAAAKSAVTPPAVILIIIAGLSILAALVGLVMPGGGFEVPPEMADDPNWEQLRPWMERAQSGNKLTNVLMLVLSGIVLFGSIQMLQLKNYKLAMAAAIVALIPCFGSCCCLGIPFGIWALVILNKPEVKAAFQG